MILGRSWQFDVDVTYKGRDNVYVFMRGGQKVVLGLIKEDFSVVEPKTKGKLILLVDIGKFIEETKGANEIFAVVVGEGIGTDPPNIPRALQPLLVEFQEIIPSELLDGLSLIHDIQHQIHFDSRG
jgi:hypothetical protein